MFAKPYKLKSNNALKNSEKKHLAQRIQEEFPAATDEKVKELVPSKSSTICMKLVLHSGETVGVYAVDGVPIVLETEGGLVPTVCALWKVPDLVPTITIHSPVLPKVLGGAPLYLPGVAAAPGGAGFPLFPRGAVLAARTQDNRAAAIVGRASISSADMLLRTTGVCMETIHVYGDQLCKEAKFGKIERPRLGLVPSAGEADNLADHVQTLSLQPSPQPARDEWPSLGAPRDEWPSLGAPQPRNVPPAPAPVHNEPKLIPDEEAVHTADCGGDDSLVTETEESEGDSIPEDMEGLLRWCLLSFLRGEAKSVPLPLKTNLLYKNHLFPMCPPDRTLDVKKSSYKKMSKFLEAMQLEGLLEVREIEKGVAAVVAVSLAHPLVRAHRVPAVLLARATDCKPKEEDSEYVPPIVKEMFCVTANVAELFPHLKKGTALTPAQVRAALTEYVKARSLTSSTARGAVTLDPTLARVTGHQPQENMTWEALMLGVQARMTHATELRFGDEVRLCKSRLDPVTMAVANRSGNKKVTLVSNLEAYGFNLVQLSRACQLRVGASCGVTRSPGAKYDQLMLQGDQTHFVAKLLIEKYGLPKKYVEGADKALNKKK